MSHDTNQPLTKEQDRLAKALKLRKNAECRGFTIEYQQERENRENVECQKRISPATKETYDRAVEIWNL